VKNILYCFSGTGNSLSVARAIAGDLHGEVVPMGREIRVLPMEDTERVGFVFPVYMWGLPLLVAYCIKDCRGLEGKYVFAVATFGGSPGATLLQAADILKGKGAALSAGFGVKMPGNYIPMYDALSVTKQQKLFSRADEKIKMIAAAVREKKQYPPEKGNFFVSHFLSRYFYSFAAPHIPEMDKRFRVTEKCNGCGICARVCPVENIVLEQGKPQWRHHCEQCLACIQWCPQKAVEYGKKTPGRKRYHHPGIRLQDMIKENGVKG